MNIIAILALLIVVCLGVEHSFAEQGTNVDGVTFVQHVNEDTSLEAIQDGLFDMYYYSVPYDLTGDTPPEGIKVYDSIGGIEYALLVNPVDVGQFNPFAYQQVRYSLNFLVDRDYIVNDLLQGHGYPIVSNFGPTHPDHLLVYRQLDELGITYDPARADQMITDALVASGATKSGGIWMIDGEPITIKMFIRNDDPVRDSIGRSLASNLESLGFNVDATTGNLQDASYMVFGSDPADHTWHIYTGAFGGQPVVRYDNSSIASFYAPWASSMPGQNNPEYWNYENRFLDDITQKLYNEEFENSEQRANLVRQANLEAVQEAVRLFLAVGNDRYIAKDDITGIVNSQGYGITHRATLINAESPDGELAVGVKYISQSSWNPILGFRDAYSNDIFTILSDPGMTSDPFTGDLTPVRTMWEVDTDGPASMMDVPGDAKIWDPASQQWSVVNQDLTAVSKVTLNFAFSNWHNGIPMDINDILYPVYFYTEWSSQDSTNSKDVEKYHKSIESTAINTIKGIRVTGPSQVEVYTDYWHHSESEIASRASLWSSMPWEIYYAMEKIVLDGDAAFSSSDAVDKGIPWISLLDAGDSELVKAALEELATGDANPTSLYNQSIDSSDRYDASIQWITDKNHAVISNGPFYLHEHVDGERLEAKAFDDSTYPLEPNHWSYLAQERDVLEGTITIGSIAPLTGGASNYGADISEASKLAVVHFNEYLDKIEAPWSLEVNRQDSGTNPDTALDKIKELSKAGIKIIDGPALDYGINVAELATNENVLAMSCCSVTTELAQDDNVYRVVPGHPQHAAKLAGIMYADGITNVIPVGRDTLWINNFLDLTSEEFTSLNTTNSVENSIPYSTDMAAAVSDLAASVQMQVDMYGAANVAVLYVGFEENVEFIKLASQQEILDDVRWYGAELNTVSPNVTTDDQAQAFATMVQLTSVQPMVHDNRITVQIQEHFADTTLGRQPSVYANYEYDGVWLLGLAMLEAQSTDVDKVKDVLADVARKYVGASGNLELDSNGDRIEGHYATWRVIDGNWTEIVSIGGLVPITRADGAGIHRQVATEIGASDFNEYLEQNNADWRLHVDIKDTIAQGYQGPVREFDADGIQYITGPSASSGAASIKDYLDSSNMLLVSCCSTAPSLGIEKDNIFRLAPNDAVHGPVIAELLRDSGKEVLISVWRDDPFGNGLYDSAAGKFVELGGVSDDLGSYPLCTSDGCYDSLFDDLVGQLSQKVQEHVDARGSDKVAVLYIGIGETESFLERAADYPVLRTVQWMGSDANVRSSPLVSNEKIFEFLKDVNFRAGIFASDTSSEAYQRLDASFAADPRIVNTPNVYAYSSYDAVWVLGLAIEAAGNGGFEEVKRQIPLVTADYHGALGDITLNLAGDASQASYAMWGIESGGWTFIGTYAPGVGLTFPENVIGALFNYTGSLSGEMVREEAMKIAIAEFNEQNPETPLRMVVGDITNQPVYTAVQNISHDLDDEANYDVLRQVIDEAIADFDDRVASDPVNGVESFLNSLTDKDYGDRPYVFVVDIETSTVVGHVDGNIVGLPTSALSNSINKTDEQVLEETKNSPKSESWIQYMFTNDQTMTPPTLTRSLVVEYKGYIFGAGYHPAYNGNSLFVGPSSSADLAMLKAYTDIFAPDVVIVSPSSTAPSLAVQDNIFRLAPTDLHQVPAIISNLNDDGKTQLVVINRDEPWGNGIVQVLQTSYPGTIHDIIKYDINNPDYPTVAQRLDNSLLRLSHDDSEVAVAFIGFGTEFVGLANEIDDNSDHKSLDVRWYGADGVTNSPDIISDLTTAQFAAKVGLAATLFEVAPNQTSEQLISQIQEMNLPVVPYLSEVYDAVYLIGNSITVANNENITVAQAIPGVADASSGALGDYSLDDAGDLDRPLTYSTYKVAGEEPQWLNKVTLGSISGTILVDENGNGMFDGKDRGIGGIVVIATESATGQSVRTTTACDGTFSFPTVGLGEFMITVADSDGYSVPDSLEDSTITLVSGKTETRNFVIIPSSTHASISGTIFSDINGNGEQDTDDTGISGYTIHAIDVNNPAIIREAITGTDGMYTFENVSSMPCVTLVQTGFFPAGHTVLDSASSWFAYLMPEAGQEATFDVGFYPVPSDEQVTLNLYVYMDENRNGQSDPGEPGVEGFGVTVHTYTIGPETITTDSDGNATKDDLVPADFGLLVPDFGIYAPTGYIYERSDDVAGKMYDAALPLVDEPEPGSVHTVRIGLVSDP